MARYCTVDKKEASRLCRLYGLRCERIEPIVGGMVNSSFRLRASDAEYVLTVLHGLDFSNAEAMGDVSKYVRASGIETPEFLKSVGNRYVEDCRGWPVVIKRFLAGVTLKNHSGLGKLREAGRLLARLHALPIPERVPNESRELPESILFGTIGSLVNSDLYSFLERSEIRWRQLKGSGKSCLIHGDLFPDNLLLDKDGGLTILDWETASVGDPLLDLGVAVVGLCRDGDFLCGSKLAQLHLGYGDVSRGWIPACEELLEAARYAAAVLAYRRFELHNRDFQDSENARSYRELIRFGENLFEENLIKAM